MSTASDVDGATGTRRPNAWTRLTTGTGSLDIVGRKKTWYVMFAVFILVSVVSLVIRGFNLGIDFSGGSQIQVPGVGANGPISTQQVEQVFVRTLGSDPVSVQSAGTASSSSILVRSDPLPAEQVTALKQALTTELRPNSAISDSAVSGTWGEEITTQALIALGVFLVLVTLFLAFYFERAMALAALVALVHDVVVTAGVYSLVHFEVTPSTVIGLLTILGFSLYDTVVVFDKVRENTQGLLKVSRRSYPEAANLALNQTLMRSLNTSLIALLPVLGLLVVGVGLLGVGTLADLALVQLVGMIAGVISSLLLATPLLVDLKMRDKRFADQAKRVAARRTKAAAVRAGEIPPDDDPETSGRSGALATAGAPRTSSGAPRPGARPTGKAGRSGARPSGKSGRSGSRRR